jgi:hypothetical protein
VSLYFYALPRPVTLSTEDGWMATTNRTRRNPRATAPWPAYYGSPLALIVYAITLFVSAFLLFLVQPIIGHALEK